MLLRGSKAAVLRRYPFTIILKARTDGDSQPIELKADPGSKVTGVALVADYAKRGKTVVGLWIFSTEGKRLKTPLIQDVVSEEAGVIARPDTVLHGSIIAPDRMVG
jgi:hypothetical protein